MNKKQNKRRGDIKTKLVAAISMLLVSSIMMVSTTYAWFTLSTAPEVKGINTAVGANGNLEMALMPKHGDPAQITSAVGDSTKDIEEKNITWGNLVDVSERTIYGMNNINLLPSALSLTDDGKINVLGSILKTPVYGDDGRISNLADNSYAGYFYKQTQSFVPAGDDFLTNTEYTAGIRAVGTSSGMTDRQLTYRNALSAANTAKAMAANKASQSLNNNGSALANIAIAYGVNPDAKFDAEDVASLRAIIDDLRNDGGILDQIEVAYMQYILAFAASAQGGEDSVSETVKGWVNATDATLEGVVAQLSSVGVTLPTELSDVIAEYQATAANVEAAHGVLAALEADTSKTEYTWADIREAMTPLADPSAMKVNNFAAGSVKDNISDLVNSVLQLGGLFVTMESGAGVYADIADHCGDYKASVTIDEVSYNGTTLTGMSARMETKTTQAPVYLDVVKAAVDLAGAPSGAAAGTMPLTDMYGYIVDLAFRTNATDSKLLLQAEGADRIYSDNTNEATMGAGSTMTFQATTTDFSNEQVKALMGAIRIVFFNPADGSIYSYSRLDMTNPVSGTEGWTAEMYLCDADGVATGSAEIMPLTQNQATALSVLVYLDGNVVGNDDVAATAETSMSGKMNLQFASSANLVPMEYSGLYTPAGN